MEEEEGKEEEGVEENEEVEEEKGVEEEVLCVYQPSSPITCPSLRPHTFSGPLTTLNRMHVALC